MKHGMGGIHLSLNAAIFLGALLGPLLVYWLNLTVALVVAFVFRLGGAVFIWYAEGRSEAMKKVPVDPMVL